MSRHYNKNSRGRQPTQPGPRLLKTKDISDENYQEPISRRKRGSNLSKYATQVQQNKRRRVARAATSSSESSDDFDADDASDEQSDDEDDDEDDGEEPAMFAPSQPGLLVGPGLKLNANYFGADRATSVESMFGIPRLDADDDDFPDGEDCLAFEQTLFEERSDEDALYERVNDVSDSDDNDRDQFEEEQLIAEGISSEDELEEIDLLNHIDGMSAYGFGDDSEDGAVVYPPSSQESDSADTAHQRHVHFDIGADALVNPRFSESPTFSRSLLPSAMPAMQGGIFADSAKDDQPADEEYDSRLLILIIVSLLIMAQLMPPMTVYHLKHKWEYRSSIPLSSPRVLLSMPSMLSPSMGPNGVISSMMERSHLASWTLQVGSC